MSTSENDLSRKQYFLLLMLPSQLSMVEKSPKMLSAVKQGVLLSRQRGVVPWTTQVWPRAHGGTSIGGESLLSWLQVNAVLNLPLKSAVIALLKLVRNVCAVVLR